MCVFPRGVQAGTAVRDPKSALTPQERSLLHGRYYQSPAGGMRARGNSSDPLGVRLVSLLLDSVRRCSVSFTSFSAALTASQGSGPVLSAFNCAISRDWSCFSSTIKINIWFESLVVTFRAPAFNI